MNRNLRSRTVISNRFVRCVNIAAELAGLLVQIRGRPRILDMVAVAAKGLDIGLRIREELVVSTSSNPWLYFDTTRWTVVPGIFTSILMPRITKRKQITRGFDERAPCAWEGELQDLPIGWIATGDAVDAVFVGKHNSDRLEAVLCEVVWSLIPSKHAILKDGDLVEDALEPDRVVRTTLVAETQELVTAFLAANECQSYLLAGPPGTGKTTTIQHIARALDLRSLRIPLGELAAYRQTTARTTLGTNIHDAWTLSNVIVVTKPDILIIDDIDRADVRTQNELLEFVDSGRFNVKVFLASANDIRAIIPPLRRPERFDEHLNVPPLSLEERRELLKEADADVADKMEGWPVCYVSYYVKLVRIRGREKARARIPELQRRIDEALAIPDNNHVDLAKETYR